MCARLLVHLHFTENTTPPSSLMFISGHTKVIPSFPWLMIDELETPHTRRFLRTEIKQNTHTYDVQRYKSNCVAIFEWKWNYVMQMWVNCIQQINGDFKLNESFEFASLGYFDWDSRRLQFKFVSSQPWAFFILCDLILDPFICAIIQIKNMRHKNKFSFFFSVSKTLKTVAEFVLFANFMVVIVI